MVFIILFMGNLKFVVFCHLVILGLIVALFVLSFCTFLGQRLGSGCCLYPPLSGVTEELLKIQIRRPWSQTLIVLV